MEQPLTSSFGGLYRSEEDAIVAGVCGGVAARLRINALWIRLSFAVAALASVFGLVAYALLALIMPTADEGDLPLGARMQYRITSLWSSLWSQLQRGPLMVQRWVQMRQSDDESERGRAIAGGALVGLGLYILLTSFGLLDWLTFGRLIAVVLCLVGVGIIVSTSRE